MDGYTFPLMLIILAALAYGAQRLELAQSYRIRRDKEEELLFRGGAYLNAIKAFYSAAASERRYPRTLAELISDPRSKGRRFIRQLYDDPIKEAPFALIQAPDGTITGVFSPSTGVPLRAAGFAKDLPDMFEKAKTYADWHFDAGVKAGANTAPSAAAVTPASPGAATSRVPQPGLAGGGE